MVSHPASDASKSNQSRSFADVVRNPPLSGANLIPIKPVSGANRVPLGQNSGFIPRKSVHKRIIFPDRCYPRHGGSSLVHEQPVSIFKQTRCSRCLTTSHSRNRCSNAIKCLVYHGWGHVAATCFKELNSKGKTSMDIDPIGKNQLASLTLAAKAPSYSSWFRLAPGQPIGPSSSRPPIFDSFGDFAAHLAEKSLLIPRQPVIVNWSVPLTLEVGPVSCELTLEVALWLLRDLLYHLSLRLIILLAKKTLAHL